MNYNGFEFNKLDYLKTNIDDPVDGIPPKYGIYQWVYWPAFDPNLISTNDLVNILIDYSAKNFHIEEEIKGKFKFHAKIWEQGYRDNQNMFGLNDTKHAQLVAYLGNRANIITFSDFFKEICFVRPFYLGKANNLRTRLKQHFAGAGGSHVMGDLLARGVPEHHVYVGYRELPHTPVANAINNIFEEIYSRRIKPGLSIKPD